MTNPLHLFLYAASRCGKTTLAADFHKAGHSLLAVTREPGPTKAALDASGVECPLLVPKTPEELFVLLEYTDAYLAKHLPGVKPGCVLFDNLQGIQQLLIGAPAEPKREVAGLIVEAQPATGIMRLDLKGRAEAPGQPGQMDYGVLGRFTRRFLSLVDALPFYTIITATESLDFDEKHQTEAQGLNVQQAAGRPRRVKGYPATEGRMTKTVLPSLVAGPYLHLTKKDGKFFCHTQTHTDRDGVEWFADPRGLKQLKAEIDWTNQSGYATLLGGR